MKRNLLIGLLLLGAGSINLHAQTAAKTPVSQELNLQNFWFNSRNAAAMAFSPLNDYASLDLKYSRAQGSFKSVLEPQGQNDIVAASSGAVHYKGFALYGDFSYTNSFSQGSLYNANLYQPRFSMPYYIADFNPSDWKRQSYDMGFKVSFPTLAAGRLAFGADVRYSDKVGAKQIDPRALSYVVDIQVAPSVAYNVSSKTTLGLALNYERYKERTQHSCENYRKDQPVALMRGVANNSTSSVGGNMGVNDYLYSGNSAGASLSFCTSANAADLFAEVSGGFEKVTVMENPRFPRMRGATSTIYADAAFKANMGAKRNHRIKLEGDFSRVTGSEYTQELVTSPKREWKTLAVTPMSSYMFINVLASYDFYRNMTADSYTWKIGADAVFDMMDQVYFASAFNNMAVESRIRGAYNAIFSGGSTLLTSVAAGYRHPLSGQFINAGTASTQKQILNEMYPSELGYLMSSNVNAGLSLTYSFLIGKKQTIFVRADAQYFKPLSAATDRFVAAATVGLLF